MPSEILGRRLTIITKSGLRHDYTHITYLEACGEFIEVWGETDDVAGGRVNAKDIHKIEDLEIMVLDFYKPRV